MASENVILLRTEKAAVDLSALQFTLVKYDGSSNLVPATEGDRSWSLQDNPKAGEHGSIALVGVAKAIVGATITAGGIDLASDGSGHLIPADSGDAIVGISLAAGAVGDVAEFQTATGAKP